MSVAVIGAGPAGCAVATHLARAGVAVGLIDPDQRPPLIVGESLVPAVMPLLRELDVEAAVAAGSTYKPGATFVLAGGQRVRTLRFSTIPDTELTYAYNVPRDVYDVVLRDNAVAAGARWVPVRAQLERVGEDGVRLSEATLAACDGVFGGAHPSLIIDATGRSRLVARTLGLPSTEGPRKDTALFAHVEGVPVIDEGHVHTDVLERGWSWRIPLPGRVSVGFVVPTDHADTKGATAEERFDTLIRTDAVARGWHAEPRRLSPVLKYNNYQLVSHRGAGPGWALVGDAFGFVDPVFSSGMLIGLTSARQLADAVLAGTPAAMVGYERQVQHHLRSWQRAVAHFYSGRLFTLLDAGEDWERGAVGARVAPHFRRHIPRVFTGEATTARYSLGLLDRMCQHALMGRDPTPYAVR